MKSKRLMVVEYRSDKDVERLKTCLDMCCMPFLAWRECVCLNDDGTTFPVWKIYIDKGRWTWERVKTEVNRVHAVRFRYISGMEIRGGRLYG